MFQTGPILHRVRTEQRESNPHGRPEQYSRRELNAVLQYESVTAPRHGTKEHCNKVHSRGCTTCKTCHFCRQKTTDVKAQCSQCSLSWCVSCLDCRYGVDLDEVRGLADWTCPVCLSICNCSAPNCHRGRMGWLPTNQLVSEASNLGYRSVAHYLVLTALEGVPAAELANMDLLKRVARQARALSARRTPGAVGDAPARAAAARLPRGTVSSIIARYRLNTVDLSRFMQRSAGDVEPDGGQAPAPPQARARSPRLRDRRMTWFAAADSDELLADDDDDEGGDDDFVASDNEEGPRQTKEQQMAAYGQKSTALPVDGKRNNKAPPPSDAADGDDADSDVGGDDVSADAGGDLTSREREAAVRAGGTPPAGVQPAQPERVEPRYAAQPQPSRRGPVVGVAQRPRSRSPVRHAGFGGPAVSRQPRRDSEWMEDDDDDAPTAGGHAARDMVPTHRLLAPGTANEAQTFRAQQLPGARAEGPRVHQPRRASRPSTHGTTVRQSTGARPACARSHVSDAHRPAKKRRNIVESGSDVDEDDHRGGDAGDESDGEGRYAKAGDIPRHLAGPVDMAPAAEAAPMLPPAVVAAAPDDDGAILTASADSAWGALLVSLRPEDWNALTPALRMQRAGQLLRRLPKGAVLGEAARDVEPLAASAGATDGVLPLCCIDDLEVAVDLLNKLAAHLPVAQVKAEVLQRLAVGPKAMLDFGGSMPAARLVVLYGLHLVMKQLVRGKHSIADAASMFVQHACAVADELQRLGPKTLRGVGARDIEEQRKDLEQVLHAALVMLASVMDPAGPLPTGAAGMLHNGLVVSMLDLRRPYEDNMRAIALIIVAQLADFACNGSDAEHVELSRCLISPAGGAWQALLGFVNVHYPRRCPDNGALPAASKLLTMTFTPLGVMAAAALRHKLLPWSAVEDAVLAWHGLAPSGRAQFWTVAVLGYQHLATELLAATVGAAPELLGTEVPMGLVIRAWTVMVAHRLMHGTGQAKHAVRVLSRTMQKPAARAKLAPLFDDNGNCDDLHSGTAEEAARGVCAILDRVCLPGLAPDLRSGLVQTGRVLVDIVAKSQKHGHVNAMLAHYAAACAESLPSNVLSDMLAHVRRAPGAPSHVCHIAKALAQVYSGAAFAEPTLRFFHDSVLGTHRSGPPAADSVIAVIADSPLRAFALRFLVPAYCSQAHNGPAFASAALGALRLATKLLSVASFDAVAAELPHLLLPLVDALKPADAGATPAHAVRVAVLELLTALVKHHGAQLLDSHLAEDVCQPVPAVSITQGPLRTGALLAPRLLSVVVGKLISAALLDGLGAMHAEYAVYSVAPHNMLTCSSLVSGLDNSAADVIRSQLLSGLGYAQQFPPYQHAFLPFLLRTAQEGGAQAPMPAREAVPGLAALQLANSLAQFDAGRALLRDVPLAQLAGGDGNTGSPDGPEVTFMQSFRALLRARSAADSSLREACQRLASSVCGDVAPLPEALRVWTLAELANQPQKVIVPLLRLFVAAYKPGDKDGRRFFRLDAVGAGAAAVAGGHENRLEATVFVKVDVEEPSNERMLKMMCASSDGVLLRSVQLWEPGEPGAKRKLGMVPVDVEL